MREYPKGTDDWEDVSKKDADYRKGTPAEHCGNCTMFRPPKSCTLVEGIITYSGVCDYFKQKT